MKTWFSDLWARVPGQEQDPYSNGSMPLAGGVFDSLQDLGRWDELAAEVAQEGQGRVVIAGLPQSGKRLLLNRLRGWDMANAWKALPPEQTAGIGLESYGSFLIADLTQPEDGRPIDPDEWLALMGNPALILYVIDAGRGVLAADYRWVALLRAGGRPTLVALNNITECDEPTTVVDEANRRLGATVIPLSAETGLNVEEMLLPALLNAVPRLAVPLGREIQGIRRLATRRIIRQVALFAGILGAQPIPLLDLPFQIMLQSGMVMRVGASFGHAPGGGLNREIIATVAGSLMFRYLALTLIKLVPVVGWLISGALSAGSTLLIGEAAIAYYAAGGTIPLGQWLRRPGSRWRLRRRGDIAAAVPEAERAPVEDIRVEEVSA